MQKDEALKQWSDELRQDGLYVSSVIKAAFSDGWERAKKDDGWISVKDRLPEQPGEYLLFRPTAHVPPVRDPNVTIREYFGPDRAGNDKFGGAHEVTHWMPLPCAPAAEA